MQLNLEQAGGSFKSRWETWRFRRHRPGQQVGTATIGRREVGIPGTLHGLTIRDFSIFLTSFGWPGDKLPDNRRECRQTHLSQDIYEHVQFIRTVCSHAHALTTRGSRMHSPGLRIGVLKIICHPSVMSHPLQHLSLSTTTRSLSPTSPIFRPPLLPQSGPLEMDPYTVRDSMRSGGFTEIPSPTGYEPKVIQSDDLEPRSIELDRNLGTDPNQIQERFMRNSLTEDMDEFGKVGAETSYLQSQMHSDYTLSGEHCRLEPRRWRTTKNAGLTTVFAESRRLWILSNANRNGETCCIVTGERSKWEACSSWFEERLDVKFISGTESIGETWLHCFHQGTKNRGTNSRVLFSHTLIRQMWDDLFLQVIKIICSIRQYLNLWSKNNNLDLSTIVSVSSSNNLCAQRLELQDAHQGYIESRREQARLQEE